MAGPDGASARPGHLVGVGVGPGDPELVTVAALRAIASADRVMAPTTAADVAGRAESIVAEAAPGTVMERVVFDMGAATSRAAAFSAAARAVVSRLDSGETVAFVTLGDPNIYSTFSSMTEAVRAERPRAAVTTVPGIMAFQDLAARSGTVLLDGTEALSLVTALDGPGAVEAALSQPDRAVAVYKGGRHLQAVVSAVERAGRSRHAVMGELLGLPGERIVPLAGLTGPAGYLATVLVPPAGRSAR